MRTRRIIALALTGGVVAPAPAFANADADAIAGSHGVDSLVSIEETPNGRRSGRAKSECTWQQVEVDVGAELDALGGYSEPGGRSKDPWVAEEPGWVAPGTPGIWYWIDCSWGERYLVFTPAGAPVSPERLARQAKEHLSLSAPIMTLRPSHSDIHYVNSETWLSVADWGPRQSTVSVPGVSVTVDAVPVRVEWRIEVGTVDARRRPALHTVMCAGPGATFRDDLPEDDQTTDCGWVWPRASAGSSDGKLGITAVAIYRVTWSAVGAPAGGTFDELESEPTTVRVVVDEIQTKYRRRR